MPTEVLIQPLNVTAATMLVQLLLMCVLAVASKLAIGGASTFQGLAGSRLLQWSPLFSVSIVSLSILMLSGEFYAMWSPILGGPGLATMTAATATTLVFFIDIVTIAYLVLMTGGSAKSPFLTALFTIPALAIFLRATPIIFVSLAVMSVIFYALLFRDRYLELQFPTEASRQNNSAAFFVNVACLSISMFTGYITRPTSIEQIQRANPVAPSTTESLVAPTKSM